MKIQKADKSSFAGTKNDSSTNVDGSQASQPIAKPDVSSSPVCKPIKDGDFMPFIGRTQKLGRAEFAICPQWKRGKLVKISIYPLQQEDRSYYYEWEGHGKRNFTIQSYCNLDEPKVWMHSYCREHKCHSMRVYVPNGAKFLWFQVYSNSVTIGFTNKQWSS